MNKEHHALNGSTAVPGAGLHCTNHRMCLFSFSAWGLRLTFSIISISAPPLGDLHLVASSSDCSPGAARREPLGTRFFMSFSEEKTPLGAARTSKRSRTCSLYDECQLALSPGARLDSGLAMPLPRATRPVVCDMRCSCLSAAASRHRRCSGGRAFRWRLSFSLLAGRAALYDVFFSGVFQCLFEM